MASAICMSTLSMLIQMLVMRMFHQSTDKPLPAWMRCLINRRAKVQPKVVLSHPELPVEEPLALNTSLYREPSGLYDEQQNVQVRNGVVCVINTLDT